MDKDLKKSFKLASKGDEKEKLFLAKEIFNGSETGRIPADSKEGKQITAWMAELIRQGNTEAKLWGSILLHNQKDYENAARGFLQVLEKASEGNQPPNGTACGYIAYYYYYGYAVEKDLETAESFANLAISNGEKKISTWVMAMLCLEKMKKDTSKNWLTEMKEYLKISAKNGYNAAKKAMLEMFNERI